MLCSGLCLHAYIFLIADFVVSKWQALDPEHFTRKVVFRVSPQTTKDSEGSSDSDDNCEPTKENTKKKIRKGCVVAIDKESEDSASDSSALSEQRWGRKNVEHSDIVVLPSNPSQAQ